MSYNKDILESQDSTRKDLPEHQPVGVEPPATREVDPAAVLRVIAETKGKEPKLMEEKVYKVTKAFKAFSHDRYSGHREPVDIPVGTKVFGAPDVDMNDPQYGEPVAWFAVELGGTRKNVGAINLPMLKRGWAKDYLSESKEFPVPGEDVPHNYYEWPHPGWWQSKESKARGMTISQLHYARLDCDKAARSNPNVESKYRDEGSVYAMEMRRRGLKKESKDKGPGTPPRYCDKCGLGLAHDQKSSADCPQCKDKAKHDPGHEKDLPRHLQPESKVTEGKMFLPLNWLMQMHNHVLAHRDGNGTSGTAKMIKDFWRMIIQAGLTMDLGGGQFNSMKSVIGPLTDKLLNAKMEKADYNKLLDEMEALEKWMRAMDRVECRELVHSTVDLAEATTTVNRGWLFRKAKEGKLLARLDYSYDDMDRDGPQSGKTFHSVVITNDFLHAPSGTIPMNEYDFQNSGRAWKDEKGKIVLMIHGNLYYELKVL